MRWVLAAVCLMSGCDLLLDLRDPKSHDAAIPPDASVPGNWVHIAVGGRHACGIDQNAHLACWGDATFGATASTLSSLTPQRVGDQTWQAIAAAGWHTCGISAGAVYCWGRDISGEIDGHPTSGSGSVISTPMHIPLGVADPHADLIAVGAIHNCAIAAGALWCWGSADRMPDGTSTVPTQIMPEHQWTAVATGADHTCALDTDGEVYCFGGNDHAQAPGLVNLGEKATSVGAGFVRSCAVTTSGVQCWGRLDDETDHSPPTLVLTGAQWTGVVVGAQTCATGVGVASCFGSERFGGLGDGRWTNTRSSGDPIAYDEIAMSNALDTSENTCGIHNGNLECWGDNRGGIQGIPPTLHVIPATIAGTWTSVASGTTHVCAIDNQKKLACWGDDASGEVTAKACTTLPCVAPPTAIINNIDDVVAGVDHTCFRAGTQIECIGANDQFQLGDPTAQLMSGPFTVANATKLIGGYGATCAIDNDGKNSCWGPVAASSPLSQPTQLVTSGISSIGFSPYATCASRTDHALECFGYGYWGILSDNQDHMDNTPSRPGANTNFGNFFQVSFQTRPACAIVDGGAKCWGKNDFMESDPTKNDSAPVLTARQVLEASTPLGACTSIAAGDQFSCAVCDGAPHCWGNAQNGYLGRGEVSQIPQPSLPVSVPTGHTWQTVVAGTYHACALSSDNLLVCWGLGVHGEFADGSRGSYVPVAIAGSPP